MKDGHDIAQMSNEIVDSMDWVDGTSGMMRALPSDLFWQGWHADKQAMKRLGFQVYKTNAGWAVFVMDPVLINLLRRKV